jgi:hypothetical protein
MKILAPKRDEMIGGWRKLHNEESNNLYPSPPNIIRMMKSRRMGEEGHVARMEETRTSCRILVRKPKGKRLTGRLRHRWEEIIKNGS